MILSIITVNLNNAAGLRKTIESVINQSFCDYEFIIIDGGSTDGSTDVIKEYVLNIDYWVSERDNGIYNAMNKGLSIAKGDYVNFLNSGDTYVASETLENVLRNNYQEDILYGNQCYEINGAVRLAKYPSVLSMSYFYEGTLNHQASFIKRSLFEGTRYIESYKIASDWAFFVQKIILEHCSYRFVDQVIVYFDTNGLSFQDKYTELSRSERADYLNRILPERVLADFQTLSVATKSELFENLIFLQQTSGFRRIIANIVSLFVSVYCFLKRIEK